MVFSFDAFITLSVNVSDRSFDNELIPPPQPQQEGVNDSFILPSPFIYAFARCLIPSSLKEGQGWWRKMLSDGKLCKDV